MYALKTENLTKQFGTRTVVNNINLNVKKGHIFGFLGKNGAGKSTFINMITGIITPTKGNYYLLEEGENSKDYIKKRIGVLPDYSTFYEDLTALEHLRYFSKLLDVKISKEELIQLLKKVGLEDAITMKTKKFSFGMKKKLGIAQAIVLFRLKEAWNNFALSINQILKL